MNEEIKNKEKYILQKDELKETHEWIDQYRTKKYRKNLSFSSYEMGGHINMKEDETMDLIGPSRDEIRSILKNYSEKLGFNYVAR